MLMAVAISIFQAASHSRILDFLKEIAYLSLIKAMCYERGISLTAVIFPYFKKENEYLISEKEDRQKIMAVLEKLGIDYLDLDAFFSEEKRLSLRNKIDDFIHRSQEGLCLAVKHIYKFLFFKLKGD